MEIQSKFNNYIFLHFIKLQHFHCSQNKEEAKLLVPKINTLINRYQMVEAMINQKIDQKKKPKGFLKNLCGI